MSIASEIERIKSNISSAYNECNSKSATMPEIQNSENLPNTIASIPTGGGSQYPIIEGDGEHEVRFIDFDGTVLKIQYVNDGEDATPPELPEHELLTFIGWNNETYLNVTRDEDVGASYNTTDGKTHIWHYVNEDNGFSKTLNIQNSIAGTATIDWGDGATTSLTSGTGRRYGEHTYKEEGNYEITITHNGEFILGYAASENYSFFGDLKATNININSGIKKIYCDKKCRGVSGNGLANAKQLEIISLGNASNFSTACITGATKLKTIVINPSKSGGSFGTNMFRYCDLTYFPFWGGTFNVSNGRVLERCTPEKLIYPKTVSSKTNWSNIAYMNSQIRKLYLPEDITSISTYLCYYAYKLEELIIPEGVTTIGNYLAYFCYNLKKVILPSTLTSLGTNSFAGNLYLKDIYVYATTPPTLGGTNCFTNVPALCKIHVPAQSLEAYKTATNWSAQASKMVGDL